MSLSALQPALSQHPIDPSLISRLGEDLAGDHGVVPLFVQNDELYVAIASPTDQALIREVQRRTGYKVTPRVATKREIENALAVGRGERRLGDALREPLRRMLLELWLRPDLVELREDAPTAFQEVIERGFLKQGGQGSEPVAEAVSLLLYLPRVRLERFEVARWWSLVVPIDLMVAYRIVPFLKIGAVLFVASPELHTGEVWRELERQTGYRIQPVLCSVEDWDSLALHLDEFARREDQANSGELEEVARVSDREVLTMARLIAANSGEPEEAVLARLLNQRRNGFPGAADQTQRSIARLLELARLRPIDSELRRRLPRQVSEALAAVPFALENGAVRVALARDTEFVRQALEALLEGPFEAVHLPEQPLAELRDHVYPASSRGTPRGENPVAAQWPGVLPEVSLGEFLVRCRYITQQQLHDAEVTAARTGDQLGAVLVAMGSLTERDLLEGAGLKFGIPYVDARAIHPSRTTVNLLRREDAEQLGTLPVWTEDPILFVAIARPFDPDLVNDIERACGRVVRPVFAMSRPLIDAIERLYVSGHVIDWSALREFGQYLVRQRLVTQQQLSEIYRRVEAGATPDIAMFDTGLAPMTYTRAMAEFFKVRAVSLVPTEKAETVFDSLGNRTTRIIKVDPVNANVARALSRTVSEAVPALALERQRNGIVVVIPDPFDTEVVPRIEADLGQPMIMAIGSRQQIADAVRRTIGRKSLGDYLLEDGLITPDQLEKALELSRNTGVRIGKAMLSLGIVGQDELLEYLANQHQLPLFDLTGLAVESDVVRLLPEELERARGLAPIAVNDQTVTLATVDVVDRDLRLQIEEELGRRVEPVLVTESDLEEILERVYRFDYLERARNELLTRSPDDSAVTVLSNGQKIFFLALLAGCALFALVNAILLLQLLIGLATLLYTMFSAYKFYLIYKALAHTLEVPISEDDLASLDDRDLPVYTILVPMYKEPEVLPILTRAMARMDYPKTKLEVLLLLEEDDKETIEVARAQRLPAHFQIIIVPDGQPKGKPKACNYGLLHAKGEYCVIYDAEDLPDPDQLKKAIVAFRKGAANLACIQAKLNYFNRDQNLLTKWFTTEYSMWFDLFLPGLDASNAPIPLGGTSNHFRTGMLKELGGWDPYNVTEDADLGTRLFKLGWKTAVIDSTTYEEANSAVYNWIRQRSRWVKGYIQTWLVHMRHPVRLFRALGPYGFFSFQMVILGTFFGFLLNPVFWWLTALWFLTKWGLIQQLFPGMVFYMGSLGLYFGNFAFVYMNVAGCLRREYYDMVKYALLSPAYWALMSIAAWKGFLQLFYAPSYWEKTQHGLYKGDISMAPARLKDLI